MEKTSLHKKFILGPTSSQNFWWNIGWRPSRPGSFIGLKNLMAMRFLVSLKGVSKINLISELITLLSRMGVK